MHRFTTSLVVGNSFDAFPTRLVLRTKCKIPLMLLLHNLPLGGALKLLFKSKLLGTQWFIIIHVITWNVNSPPSGYFWIKKENVYFMELPAFPNTFEATKAFTHQSKTNNVATDVWPLYYNISTFQGMTSWTLWLIQSHSCSSVLSDRVKCSYCLQPQNIFLHVNGQAFTFWWLKSSLKRRYFEAQAINWYWTK